MWSKKDSIYLNSNTAKTVVAPVVIEEVHYIDYTIAQHDTGYTLSGNFKNAQQQTLLDDTFNAANISLKIENASNNEALHGEAAVALTNKILPHFITNYSDGKIVYSNQKLSVSGTVNNYEAQHEMQRLLNTSTIASQDTSDVLVNTAINYTIDKKENTLHVEGTFNDEKQIETIKTSLPTHATSDLQMKPHHVDKGSLPIVEKFLPTFLKNYTSGKITYIDEKLSISGTVHSQAEVDEVQALLSHAGIPVINSTTIDLEALAKAEAEDAKKARLAALEVERLEAAKAEKARLVQEAKKASELQAENAKKARLAALEVERLEAAKKVGIKNEIAKLFKLENIAFNVNKSTLTTKGQHSVNKLASILKKYPLVNIEIAGHTDSDGSAIYNQKLSQSRVDMVKKKLVAQEISASRLIAKGYGEAEPLVKNTTPSNKAKNRRVEINIQGE